MRKLLMVAALTLLPLTAHAQVTLDCSGDATGPWNKVMADAVTNSSIRTLLVPTGQCFFNSRPMPNTVGVTVKGQGIAHSALIAAYHPGSTTEQFIHFDGGTPGARGGGMVGLTICKTGNSGGRAIMVSGYNDSQRAGYLLFDDLYITTCASGSWWRNFDIDGINIQDPGGQGVRNITIRDSYGFCATDANIYARNAVHLTIRGGAYVIGTGTCAGVGKIRITGGGSQLANSTDFSIDTKVYGDIVLEQCDIGHVSGIVTGNVSIATSCTNRGALVAQVNGTITNSAGWKIPAGW